MAKKLVCALTHVREETFFLQKWIDHYGAIVGHENLYVVLDGSDWEPRVDLSGVNVQIMEGSPRERFRNDRFVAKEMSRRAHLLRKKHNYVLRTDCDEFVVVDPASGLDWPEALTEIDAEGYIFALGVDVIQTGTGLSPVNPERPILAQRPYGLVSGLYSKAIAISRWNNWAGGAHRLINRPVRISQHFVLFHMALSDYAIAQERHAGRGGQGQHDSHVSYIDERFAVIDAAAQWPVADEGFDALAKRMRHEFAIDEEGQPRKRPPTGINEANFVHIPERFLDLV